MLKRVLAALLWFYAGWYGGNLLADFLGISLVLGPIIGATLAALVVGDPRRIDLDGTLDEPADPDPRTRDRPRLSPAAQGAAERHEPMSARCLS